MVDGSATGPGLRDELPTADGLLALLALTGLSHRTAAESLGIDPERMLQYTQGQVTIPRYVMLALRYLALKSAAGNRPVRLDGTGPARE